MDPARANGLVRARGGVTAIFFANGLCIGAWAVAIPEIKALFGLTDARLSIVLLAAGVGGLSAMPVAGVLPSKIGGTGRALRISGPLMALLLAALPQTHLLSPGIGLLAACAFHVRLREHPRGRADERPCKRGRDALGTRHPSPSTLPGARAA